MSHVNWREILGWQESQLDELRSAGFSFLREGKYDKALLFFKSLRILDPKSAYDVQTLGAIYLQMNEKELAVKTLKEALDLDPTHEPTRLNLVKALLITERKKEAFTIAKDLQLSADPSISNDASALLDSYS